MPAFGPEPTPWLYEVPWVAVSIAILAAILFPVFAQALALKMTASTTEGPFYPVDLPQDSDADLLRNGTGPGEIE